MTYKKVYCHSIPPSAPGSYRIRDANGDILYWGDSANLYDTWCEKVRCGLYLRKYVFEFSVEDYSVDT